MAKGDKSDQVRVPIPEAPNKHYKDISEQYSSRQESHFQHEQNIQKIAQAGLFVEVGDRPILVWRLEGRRLYRHQQTPNSWSIPGVADAGGFGVRYNGAPNTGPEIQAILSTGEQTDYTTLPANLRRQGYVFAHNEHQNQVSAYTNQGGNTIGTSTATNPVGASNGGTFTAIPNKGTEKTLFLNALTKGNKFIPITALFQNDIARNEHHSFDDTKIVCKYDQNRRPIYTVPLKNKAGEFIKNDKGKIQTLDVRDENIEGEMKLSYIENKNETEFFHYMDQHDISTGYYTTKQDRKSEASVRINGKTYTTSLLSQIQADGTVKQKHALVSAKEGNIHFLDDDTAKTIELAIEKANIEPQFAVFIKDITLAEEPDIKSARIDASVWAGQDVLTDKSAICEQHGITIKDIQEQIIQAQRSVGQITPAHTSFEYELATTHIAMEQILCGVNLKYTGEGNKWEVTGVDRNHQIDEKLLDSKILADENVRLAFKLASEKVKHPEETVILDYDELNRKTGMDKHLGLEYLAESHNEAATRTLQDMQKIVKKVQHNVHNMQKVVGAEEMKLSDLLQDIPRTLSPETKKVKQQLETATRNYSIKQSITRADLLSAIIEDDDTPPAPVQKISSQYVGSEEIFVTPDSARRRTTISAKRSVVNPQPRLEDALRDDDENTRNISEEAKRERRRYTKEMLESGVPGYVPENREKIKEIFNNPGSRVVINDDDLSRQDVSKHIESNIQRIQEVQVKEKLTHTEGQALSVKFPRRMSLGNTKFGERSAVIPAIEKYAKKHQSWVKKTGAEKGQTKSFVQKVGSSIEQGIELK